MSRLLGRMVFLVFFLLFIGMAAGQEDTRCVDGTCTLDENELHAIIQNAYQLGYKKGYREGSQERRIIQITPSGLGEPSGTGSLVPAVVPRPNLPRGGEEMLLPSLPGVSTGQ